MFREDSYNANQRWMGTGRTLLDITTTGMWYSKDGWDKLEVLESGFTEV